MVAEAVYSQRSRERYDLHPGYPGLPRLPGLHPGAPTN
jgi:hypothetical protein